MGMYPNTVADNNLQPTVNQYICVLDTLTQELWSLSEE